METRIQTRWPDFDALGHLNHAVYHVYLDEARDEALRSTVGDFNAWPNVVVHASIDYRREVALGVREIIVRTQIAEVGRSSVRFEQAIVTGALGFVIGIGLTLLFGPLASKQVPQFVTAILWQDVLAILGATVVMSLAAGYVPVRRLAAIDPVAAFKA